MFWTCSEDLHQPRVGANPLAQALASNKRWLPLEFTAPCTTNGKQWLHIYSELTYSAGDTDGPFVDTVGRRSTTSKKQTKKTALATQQNPVQCRLSMGSFPSEFCGWLSCGLLFLPIIMKACDNTHQQPRKRSKFKIWSRASIRCECFLNVAKSESDNSSHCNLGTLRGFQKYCFQIWGWVWLTSRRQGTWLEETKVLSTSRRELLIFTERNPKYLWEHF